MAKKEILVLITPRPTPRSKPFLSKTRKEAECDMEERRRRKLWLSNDVKNVGSVMG